MKGFLLSVVMMGLVNGGLISKLLGRNKEKVPYCDCQLKYMAINRGPMNACACIPVDAPIYNGIYQSPPWAHNNKAYENNLGVTLLNQVDVAQPGPGLGLPYVIQSQPEPFLQRIRKQTGSAKTKSKTKISYKVSVKEKVKTTSRERISDSLGIPSLGF